LSEQHHLGAWINLAAAAGCALPEGFLERGLGASDEDLAQELADTTEGRLAASWLLEQKRSMYLAHLAGEMTLVPGVVAALEYFHQRVPLGLATSSCWQDIAPVMERYGLRRFFSAVFTIEDVERPKPDPEIYLKAAQAIGCAPVRTFVFEDSRPGVGAALAAGMQVIALTTTLRREELPKVAAYIPDFQGLDDIVAAMGFHFQQEIC
jgi:HAD superfamily hydrolase (TIGR01509 family)